MPRAMPLMGEKPGIEQLRADCSAIRAWSKNNYLPLLWKHYRSYRKVLLQVLRSLRLETPSTDGTLLRAVAIIPYNDARRPRNLELGDVDMTFCSERWKKLILHNIEGVLRIDRRH